MGPGPWGEDVARHVDAFVMQRHMPQEGPLWPRDVHQEQEDACPDACVDADLDCGEDGDDHGCDEDEELSGLTHQHEKLCMDNVTRSATAWMCTRGRSKGVGRPGAHRRERGNGIQRGMRAAHIGVTRRSRREA